MSGRMKYDELVAVRERLGTALDFAFEDAQCLAHIDQLAASLRTGFVRCGVDPSDDEVLDALMLYAETFLAALARHQPFETLREMSMWAATTQLTSAVLALDRARLAREGDR